MRSDRCPRADIGSIDRHETRSMALVQSITANAGGVSGCLPMHIEERMTKTKSTSNKTALDTLSQRKACLDAARRYCERGLPVLPLEPAKKGVVGSGKRPISPNGYKDATTDFEAFKAMVKGRDEFNIGIAITPESGILVLDYDPRNADQGAIARLTAKLGKL